MSHRPVARSVLIVLALVFSTRAFAQDSAASLAWRYEADGIVTYVEPTPLGTVVVGTNARTVAIDPSTGEPRWASEMLRDCRWFQRRGLLNIHYRTDEPLCRFGDRDDYTVLTLDPVPLMILARSDQVVVFDLGAGVPRWSSDTLGMRLAEDGWEALPELGMLLVWSNPQDTGTTVAAVDLITGELRWAAQIAVVDDIEDIAGRGMRLFFGKGASGRKTVVAIDLREGSVAFESEELGRAFDDDRRMLLTVDSTALYNSPDVDFGTAFEHPLEVLRTGKDGLIAFDAETGQIQWRVEDIPWGSWVYDTAALYAEGGGKVVAVTLADGSVRWSVGARPSSMIVTDHGLLLGCDLVACRDKFLLLDPANGRPLWSEPIELNPPTASVVWRDDHFLVTRPTSVQRVDFATGQHQERASFQLNGEQGVPALMEMEGGILVSGQQNVVMMGPDGQQRFQEYYPAPGLSTFQQVLRIGTAVALTAASFAAAQHSASQQARQNAYLNAMAGGAGQGLGVAYYQTFFPDLSERYAATEHVANSMYFYTDRPDAAGREGFSLVRFDLAGGHESGRAWVDERNPEMKLDPFLGLVFVKRDDHVVEAVRIQP